VEPELAEATKQRKGKRGNEGGEQGEGESGRREAGRDARGLREADDEVPVKGRRREAREDEETMNR
jgi:hypothetical protein